MGNSKSEIDSTGWLSLAGIIGLLWGFVSLFYNNFQPSALKQAKDQQTTKVVFHELAYHPRTLIGQAIDSLVDSLNKQVTLGAQKIEQLEKIKKGKDTPAVLNAQMLEPLVVVKRISDSTAAVELLAKKRLYQSASLADSASIAQLNTLLHFQVTPADLAGWEKDFEKATDKPKWSQKVPYWAMIGTSKYVLTHAGMATVDITPGSSNIGFLSKYPTTGAWVFLIVLFHSFCVIALVVSVNTSWRIAGLSGSRWSFVTGFLFYFGLSMLFFWAFERVGFYSFNDELYIKSIFFMKDFRGSIGEVNLLGYITGSCCLAGFLYSSARLGKCLDIVQQNRATISVEAKKIEPLKDSADEADKEKVKTSQISIITATTSSNDALKIYSLLQAYFSRFFILSAAILTLLVLCTGALYGAVNSFDFIRLLSANWGYSPVKTDIMYLYAGIHTVILLLIYLPAKFRFQQIHAILYPSQDPATDSDGTQQPATTNIWLDLLKDPFDKFKGVLVAASPFIASIIQSLIGLLFQH